MKRYNLHLFALCLMLLSPGHIIFSQIGVYTDNPQYLFHLDGKGDNPDNSAPTSSQLSDDLIIDGSGNVGVGTAPTTKLDIKGSLFLSGTNLKADMRLLSDGNGNASWKDINDIFTPIESILDGLLYGDPTGLADPNVEDPSRSLVITTTWTNITRTSIKVTPGTWLIYSSVSANGYGSPTTTGPTFFWIQLRNKTNGQVLETVGSLHEYEGGYWSKPQFVKLITFTADAELEIWAIADIYDTVRNRYGGSHFGAVKILNN